MYKKEIIEAYKKVFDEDGNVQLCGREKCKNLIRILKQQIPEVNFGDEETGFMNIENIKKYVILD